MLKFLIGFIVGYLIVTAGQLGIEKEAIKNGIIKLCGTYYAITPLKNSNGGDI